MGGKTEKGKEKRQKGRKIEVWLAQKKGKWEGKKDDSDVKILCSFSNWAWEGFKDRWNNIHPLSREKNKGWGL